MNQQIQGIHHITALASDPQRNIDFYVGLLGLRFVKRTINFDAPDVYHLYYADAVGTPGTVLTFFPFPNASRGRRGAGEVSRIAFSAPASSIDFWIDRLSKKGITFDGPETKGADQVISFQDPDGLLIQIEFGAGELPVQAWDLGIVPAEHSLRGFSGFTMYVADPELSAGFLTEILGAQNAGTNGTSSVYTLGPRPTGARIELVKAKNESWARQSAGSIHHIAWRVPDDSVQELWRKKIADAGYNATDMVDRQYFHSIYFREPGGILFEIATDGPGFTIDEPFEALGQRLQLPPWYEHRRSAIERHLIPVSDPTSTTVSSEK